MNAIWNTPIENDNNFLNRKLVIHALVCIAIYVPNLQNLM